MSILLLGSLLTIAQNNDVWTLNQQNPDHLNPGCPTFPICIKNAFNCSVVATFKIRTLVNGVTTTSTVYKNIGPCDEVCFERSEFNDPNIVNEYSGIRALAPSADFEQNFDFSFSFSDGTNVEERPTPFTNQVITVSPCGGSGYLSLQLISKCPSLKYRLVSTNANPNCP